MSETSILRPEGPLATAVWRWMLRWYRESGWSPEGQLPQIDKFILCGAPHTSNWDFLVFVGTIAAFGRRVHYMGKDTLFRWPMGNFMRDLGGVPVDRSRRQDLVQQMVEEFDRREEFILVVAPEGTRSKTERWKTGFYQMAIAARVPIVCAGPDYERRRGVIGPTIYPTGDYEKDMAPAFKFFRMMKPKNVDRAFVPD